MGKVDIVEFVGQVSFGALIVLIIGSLFFCSCSMKKWQYDECLKIGHSTAYCNAEYAGCFDGHRKH